MKVSPFRFIHLLVVFAVLLTPLSAGVNAAPTRHPTAPAVDDPAWHALPTWARPAEPELDESDLRAPGATPSPPDPNAALHADVGVKDEREHRRAEPETARVPATRAGILAYEHEYEWTGSEFIPDDSCFGTHITTTLNVPDSFTIDDLKVGLNAEHTWRSDVQAWIHSPDGRVVQLLDGTAGSSADDFDVLFADGAAPVDTDDHDISSPYYENEWAPVGSLSSFAVEDAQGDWVLELCDDMSLDTGSLYRWALFFNEIPAPDLSGSRKTTEQFKVQTGSQITYTISLSNSGDLSAANLLLTDPIPPAATYAGALACASGTCWYDGGDDAVYWTGIVTDGDSVDISFVVTSTADCGALVTNTATITDPALPATVTLQAAMQVWDELYYWENFESDDGGYTVSGSDPSWAWGVPTSGPGDARSGANVWATDLSDDYNVDEVSYLTSPVIDLSSAMAAEDYELWLEWWQWLETEGGYDFVSLEARGGGSGWTTLYGPLDGSVDDAWTEYRVDISQFAGAGDFQIRFNLDSDYMITYDGWYIDDVAVHQCAPPPGLYLTPHTVESQGCNGISQTHTLNLLNHTGSSATFDLDYALADPAAGSITGPVTLFVTDTMNVGFDVVLDPALCLPDKLDMVATVEASGNGYSDTAQITKAITTRGLWQFREGMPTARGDLAVIYGGEGGLYAIGGTVSGSAANGENERYDVVADSWATRAAMPTGLTIIDGALLTDTIYIPGGYDSSIFVSTTLAYNISADSWYTVASAPRAVAGYGVAACDGLLYRVGGTTLGQWPNGETAAEVYDPLADAWSTLAPMEHGHTWPAVACIEGHLYVAGGIDETGSASTVAEVYDIATDTWSDVGMADLPTAYWGSADFVKDGRLYVVGGIESDAASTDVIIYDSASDAWSAGPPLQDARFRLEGDFAIDSGYADGGWAPAWTAHDSNEYLVSCPECTASGHLNGHVRDFDDIGATCTDATVHIEPGERDVAVNSSGYYTVSLIPYDYQVTASASDYPQPDGPHAVTISDGATTNRDFTLSRPDVGVDPTALSTSAVATATVSEYFTVTNSGTYNLEYSIREKIPTGPTVLSLPSMEAPDASRRRSDDVGIEVEPELQNQINADGSTGYMIYFRERPDLSPAFGMAWDERGHFVMNALQETAERSQARVVAYLDARGAQYKSFWIDNIVVVESSDRSTFNGLMTFPQIAALRARRTMRLIEPVERQARSASPIVPMVVEDNIGHVQADAVWDLGIRGEGIVVANIDSGVRYTHETLEPHYRGNLGGGSFDHDYNWLGSADGDSTPTDNHGHGSHTMGIMVGDDDGTNQIGMAPGAQWIACDGCSSSGCPDAALLECAQWIAAPWEVSDTDLGRPTADPDRRPHLVNNSWGDCGTSYDGWYQGSVDAWHAAGIFPIFSNGNNTNCGYSAPPGCNTVGNPARYGNVMGVGSTGQSDGQYATHSNWGPTDDPDTVNPRGYPDLKPQVVAPGVNIRSSLNGSDSDYASWGGTSMSAPHVAGLIALMWQAAPCLVGDYAKTETLIEQTATPIPYASSCGGEGPGDVPNHATGWGEIDALAAVEAAQDYCDTDWLPWASADPVSGTLLSGDQRVRVDFTCNYTESQKPQPLQGTLLVQHNDPCQEDVEVDLEFFCSGPVPVPTWDKALWINGEEQTPVVGPHVVRSGDTVVIVDRVGAAFSQPISSVLTETWGSALELIDYDTDGVGAVTTSVGQLVWSLTDVAPSVYHPITKTFRVVYDDWMIADLVESYRVEGATDQPGDVVVAFERYVPAISLEKDGPAEAYSGDTISLTLTITSNGDFYGNAVLTDALPGGMTYAGALTYTHGRAWEDSNVIHWTSYTETTPPPILTPTDVVSDGGFEDGTPNAYWNEASINFGTPLCDVPTCGTGAGTGPRSGDWWAWFGGTNNAETGSVDQDVTIPAGNATLSFWLEIPVANIPATLTVSMDSNPLFSVTEADAGSYDPYTLVTLDVDAYADGGVHNLAFEEINDAGSGVINFFVDDVKLEVYTDDPMPSVVTITFDARLSDEDETCNLAHLDWGEDYTSDEHCVDIIPPESAWEKRVYVNDVLTDTFPASVAAGDAVRIVDRVWVTHTDNVTFTLVETWTASLDLVGSAEFDAGEVTSGSNWLSWEAMDVAANTWHALTKTFQVTGTGWLYDYVTETLTVEDADPQPGDRVVVFRNRDACWPITAVDYDWSPYHPDVGEVITFAVSTYQPPYARTPITYEWNFGDGSVGSGQLVTHTYAVSDTYTVALTATNCSGAGLAAHSEDVAVLGEGNIYLPLIVRGYGGP